MSFLQFAYDANLQVSAGLNSEDPSLRAPENVRCLYTREFDGGILGCQDTLYGPCLYIRLVVIQIYLLSRLE